MKRSFSLPLAHVISVLLVIAVLALVVTGVRQAGKAQEDEALRTLDESIRRAAVSCYAIEGSYPESVDYLEENYGVYIDENKYIVHYSIFASNIMPDITVIKK